MFPQRLKELRKSKKLTAKAFGEKFSLAESTISGYETGARKPDIELVRKFADFFDVSIDYLIGKTHDPETNKKSDVAAAGGDSEFIRKVRKIAEERGMELTDPKFLHLLDVAFDIVKRINDDKQR